MHGVIAGRGSEILISRGRVVQVTFIKPEIAYVRSFSIVELQN